MASKTRTDRVLKALDGARGSLQQLTEIWQARDATWESSSKIYQQAAKVALDLGEGFLAYDIAAAGLACTTAIGAATAAVCAIAAAV